MRSQGANLAMTGRLRVGVTFQTWQPGRILLSRATHRCVNYLTQQLPECQRAKNFKQREKHQKGYTGRHFKDGGVGVGGRVSSGSSIQDLENSGRDKVAFYFTPPHWV